MQQQTMQVMISRRTSAGMTAARMMTQVAITDACARFCPVGTQDTETMENNCGQQYGAFT